MKNKKQIKEILEILNELEKEIKSLKDILEEAKIIKIFNKRISFRHFLDEKTGEIKREVL